MDRSQQILSAIDELRQMRNELHLTESMDFVRRSFDRLQVLRREHIDDFDLQIMIADVQQELIDGARTLRLGSTDSALGSKRAERKEKDKTAPLVVDAPPKPSSQAASPRTESKPSAAAKAEEEDSDIAEIPPEVPKLDHKSWQVAIGLAAFFTVAICALFFYLIQTARHINFAPDTSGTVTGPQKPSNGTTKTVVDATPAISMTPTLRLYTDLIPGTVSIDNKPAQTLVDGELNLDNITAGDHTVKVAGRSGSASFEFTVPGVKQAPLVSGLPASDNAMVVLVSVENGEGHLFTDARGAHVLMDSKEVGEVGADGLTLADLRNIDHDLEVTQERDKQRFVLTYTPAPTLTVFVKSDPSTGILMVETGQDDVSVFINDTVYRRSTLHGQLRIPLKVDVYRIRVHKDGFIDPPAARVEVKKAEEASVVFRMQPAPEFATLQILGAQPGTTVYIDRQLATTVGPDGSAKVVNIKSGDHVIELHHDQQVTKQLTRTFQTGAILFLSGADVALDRFAADNKTIIPANPGPPPLAPPVVPHLQQPQLPQPLSGSPDPPDAEVMHKGGGFIPYQTPKTPGHYYFQAHTRLGGLLKHGKLQWYAGYQDKDNYVLFTVDGKHADVREVRDGKAVDLGKVPFDVNTDEWVQVDVALKPDSIQARVKTNEKGWSELTPVPSNGRDFTKDTVGLFIPSNDEVAVANSRFSGH